MLPSGTLGNDDGHLRAESTAGGIFVIANAYAGQYDFDTPSTAFRKRDERPPQAPRLAPPPATEAGSSESER